MNMVVEARSLAAAQLAEALPRRWTHVQAVATKARRAACAVSELDGSVLIAAAWLHDVGYAPTIAETGLHALDGARWVRDRNWPMRIAALVGNHSCATFEADERDLGDELRAEFPDEQSAVTDALWYSDMTTGPDGQDFEIYQRLAEVRERYGPDHIVTRFWSKAEPAIVAAVRRTEERLRAAGVQPM